MNINSIINAASFTPKYINIIAPGWIGHFPFAAWLIKVMNPRIFVELGTHYGNSYFNFCQSVAENKLRTKCFAIDTWRGDNHSWEYGEDVFNEVNQYHQMNNYSCFSQLLRTTFDEAITYFNDGTIDLLHIDGYHSYDAARHDFETWLPKLSSNAIVLFHDTNVREGNFGVWKLWEELQQQYPNHLEFTHSHGLGVLQLGINGHNSLSCFNGTSEHKEALLNYFSALGNLQCLRYESELHRTQVQDQKMQMETKLFELENIKNQQIEILNQDLREKDSQLSLIREITIKNQTNTNQYYHKFTSLHLYLLSRIKTLFLSIEIHLKYPAKNIRRIPIKIKEILKQFHFITVLHKVISKKNVPLKKHQIYTPFNHLGSNWNRVPTIAVICHFFYVDMIDEFLLYLKNIPFPFDTIITTDTPEKKADIEEAFQYLNKGLLEVRLCLNRGRDIAPKLINCSDVYQKYEFVLHIHTKKTPHLQVEWRSYLLNTLLGSKQIVESILEAFRLDDKLGMIAPEHFLPISSSNVWGKNFKTARNFSKKLGIELRKKDLLDFPSGSMFWARSSALMPLIHCNLCITDFPEEKGQLDGTLAHAIERLYFLSVEKAGYKWIKIIIKNSLVNFIQREKSTKFISHVNNFDEDFYLKIHPDVVNSKMNAYEHYVRYGKQEGRQGAPCAVKVGGITFSEIKENILLVSHEASRTGAPILALNIAKKLNEYFNVFVLLVKGGEISCFFEKACFKIIECDSVISSIELNGLILKHKIKYCIVNSIESNCILQPLAENFLPSVLLIHEFFTYTRPRNKLIDGLFWAGVKVFPSKVVQQNAITKITEGAINTSYVIPQGKSQIPMESGLYNNTSKAILSKIHRRSIESQPFIILGAGSVQYRKGVDLFILTAAEIKFSYPESNIQLIWVGKGFQPEIDIKYSCYLSEQINYHNLDNCFEIVEEIADLENLYKNIALFLLTSRLDPLPNVAIDVMMLGIPLICFDKGNGIAEFLNLDKDTSTCIIPYMNIVEASKKIIDLYRSKEYYALISHKVKLLANEFFNMDQYVETLIKLLKTQLIISEQEARDCATLENCSEFLEQFNMPNSKRSLAIRRYIRSWHSKIINERKPAPGFNRFIYDFYHQCSKRYVEPFAEYIRTNKPSGPWQDKVLTPIKCLMQTHEKTKCALHIHAFYPDLLSDILNRLDNNNVSCDIFISTVEAKIGCVKEVLNNYKKNNIELRIVPNKGRDIGPFLTEFRDKLQKYEIIGHMHTKKSELNNNKVVEEWVYFLLENLLGGKYQMMDLIINTFQQQPDLGLVFADDPHLMGWNANKSIADDLAKQLGLASLPETQFNFPIGTMFWARPNALKPLFDMDWTWDMYPAEPVPYDGSILHALERIIPLVVAHQGYQQAVTYIPEVTR